MRIYVGNLSYNVTEEELRQQFAAFGKVESVSIVTEKYSGRPRGFAFVEMPSRSEAEAAITALHGKDLDYRTLVVNEARPRESDRGGPPRGGGGGGFGRRERRRQF